MNVLAKFNETLRHWFREGVFRRVFKNAVLMLSGRAATGILSVATLSLMARSLGAEQFGILVLVQSYAQVITTVATLQSCQGVIRYGAISLQSSNKAAFQALMKLSTLLDAAGGLAAVAIGVIVAPILGPYVGWSKEVIIYAQAYSVLIFFTACVTPTSLLRLFDRFDVLALQTVVTPLVRLLGVGIAAALGAPIWAYLLAWFAAQIVGGVSLVYLGWREAYRRGWLEGFNTSLVRLTEHHSGILRFSLQSNLYMAMQIISGQVSIFLVGILAGPSGAGVFKIARDASTLLAKPAELLNHSITPEFARLGSSGDWEAFGRLILRGATVAAGAGAVMLALTIVIGSPLLTTLFGSSFAAAYVPMVLLVAAATLTIIGFPLDPALFAMGRAGIPLRVGTIVIFVVQLPLLVLLSRSYGPTGAAAAFLAASAFTLVAMSVFTVTQLRQRTMLPGASEPVVGFIARRLAWLMPGKPRVS